MKYTETTRETRNAVRTAHDMLAVALVSIERIEDTLTGDDDTLTGEQLIEHLGTMRDGIRDAIDGAISIVPTLGNVRFQAASRR